MAHTTDQRAQPHPPSPIADVIPLRRPERPSADPGPIRADRPAPTRASPAAPLAPVQPLRLAPAPLGDESSDPRLRVLPFGWILLGGLAAASLTGAVGAAFVWVVLAVSLTVHEGAHAAMARRVGYAVHEITIGVGPTLLRFERGELEAELRLLPLLGWVAVDTTDRGRRRHRRAFWFSAAGPAASLALATLLLFGSAVSLGGRATAEADTLASSAKFAVVGAWWTADALLQPLVDAVSAVDPFASPDLPEVPGAAEDLDDRPREPTLSNVDAVTSMASDVDSGGLSAALLWGGVLNAGMVGLNLIPAFGLDGQHMLQAVAAEVRLRRRRLGMALQLAVAASAVVLGVTMVISLALPILTDLGRLL